MKQSGERAGRRQPYSGMTSNRKLLRDLAAYLRLNRAQLCDQWTRRIRDAGLLTSMSKREIDSEAISVFENYLSVLETGSAAALRAYARNLSKRIIPRGVKTREVLGIVLLLRDVLARSLFQKYHLDFQLLNRILDAYEPAANRIANTVGTGFVEQRERVIRRQDKAIRVLRVQEEERRRISRELHDQVGHALTAINLNLTLLSRDGVTNKDSPPGKKIADLRNCLQDAMVRVHNFARDLRSTAPAEGGFLPALRSYLETYRGQTGITVRFRGNRAVERLSPPQKTFLLRVAQESLTNVAKHAGANRVDITLSLASDGFRMQIRDDGEGFSMDLLGAAGKTKKRLGLLGMQERALLVNSRLVIRSAPGKGTIVSVLVPLKRGKFSHSDNSASPGTRVARSIDSI